jgi:hypothetical protein
MRLLWLAAKALNVSPLDDRLRGLSDLQLEWSHLMANPDRRQEIEDEENTVRDAEAAAVSEWMRTRISRG